MKVGSGLMKNAGELKKLMEEEKPDLMMTFLPVADFVGRWVGRKKLPVITSLRGWKPGWCFWVDKWTAGMIQGWVPNSKEQGRFYLEEMKVSPEKILKVIPNGLEVGKMKMEKSREEIRRNLGIGLEKKMVWSTSNLRPEKGVKEILEVAKMMPEVEFVIAGEGPERGKFEEWLKKNEVGNVKLLGSIPHSEVFEGIFASDVFLFPSHTEGMPNALMEAAAIGAVLVASEIPGNEEVLGFGKNVWVKAGDVKSVKGGLEEALDLEEKNQEEWKEAGRKFARENFDLEKTVEMWENLWEEEILKFEKKR